MKYSFAKSNLAVSILILVLLSACNLFENEQTPDCMKKEGEQSPDILTCYNTLYFTRPDWHPDGDWIAAEHSDSVDTNADGVHDTWFSGIWLVHAQTGQTQPLLPFGASPDWNPDGTHLAVHAGGGIYTVEVTALEPARYDTTSITLLTDFDSPAFFPTWSGDGKWIAFDTNYNHEKGAYLVWKIKKDGTELKKVSIREFGGGRQPNWSTEGDRITITSYVTGGAEGPEIFVMKADGSGSRQLTNSGENHNPKFSPDGSKIAYEHREELNTSVWIMSTDGGSKKAISRDWSSDIAWSPDGRKIVYVFSNHYYDIPGNGQLWVMDADGSNKKQITNYNATMP